MNVLVGNDQHIGAREEQQDAFGFSEMRNSEFRRHGGVLAVLADGMGGVQGGSEASTAAVRAFLEGYKQKPAQEPVLAALRRSFQDANRAVLDLRQRVHFEDAGSTLVAAVVHDHSLYWISAGDSRLYLLRRNRLTRLTNDHVYANQLNHRVAEGTMKRDLALADSQRYTLTSYLGLAELSEIDESVRPLQLEAGDSVLLCSDGLYSGISEVELRTALKNDPQTACETLRQVTLSKHREGQDNLTVLAIQIPADSSAGSFLRWSALGVSVLLFGVLALAEVRQWWDAKNARAALACCCALLPQTPAADQPSPPSNKRSDKATQTRPDRPGKTTKEKKL